MKMNLHKVLYCPIFIFSLLIFSCDSVEETIPAYELAQGCYVLQAHENNSFLVAEGENDYRFKKVDINDAEKFFLKPSGLGTFLLYDRGGAYVTSHLLGIKRKPEASDESEWHINHLEI